MFKESKTNWIYVLVVVVLGFVVSVGILRWVVKQEIPLAELPEMKQSEKVEDETTNWKTYRNEEYGFEIKYPPTCLMEAERKNESLYIEFHAKTQEDFYICTGGFSVRKNENGLPLKEALEDLYGFYDLRLEEIEAPSGTVALKPAKEQSENYYKKFGPLGSGLEYSYWITGNDKWVFSLYHLQDGGLLADQMLSNFKFLE